MIIRKTGVTGFLFVLNILPAFVFFVLPTEWLWLMIGVQLAILLYFFKYDFALFAHSLFWPIFLASLLLLQWPASFIVPVIIQLSVVTLSDRIKNEVNWMKPGRIDRPVLCLAVPVVLVSSSALILWVYLLRPDLTDLTIMVPASSLPVIIVTGLIFSLFNSAWEEIILKGILWNGLENLMAGSLAVNLTQAFLFGVMHLNGFPRGITGAFLAGIYGLLIGFIRKKSDGLAAPVITHFFADATIFGILAFLKF